MKEHTDAVWYFGKPFSYLGQVFKKLGLNKIS